ncbi:rhodanese-like domain-containing protein [Rhodobacteraceae bacterium 2CG4]|uniref:Rhodanese-like domain-containing protein n=1 Tax=Halovulum marinum TaxID=2662447 RepID=A0A6L5Z1P9_9RHOB|nr:rhodanese-like domain-containing protein [Halovulum marinum]MSU90477.1 rhodanese-like domain-containing protein [Halovulum marinum]
MSDSPGMAVDVMSPDEVWTALETDGTAQLVDVRTRPEWSFVGVPDLSALGRQVVLAEWRRFPDMQVAPDFAESILDTLGDPPPSQIFFICRSGARSLDAARDVAAVCRQRELPIRCVNVAEGFEGDLDQNRHRGAMNGWKARGLAWQQS